MPDETTAPAVEMTRSEKMKAAWAKRKAEKAAAPVAHTEKEDKAPLPAIHAPRFHTWTSFCNEMSVRLLMTPQGYHLLSSFGDNATEIANNLTGFYGTMHKSYCAMRAAWEKGLAEFGE